jgi:FixJ family two-component response regulator
LAARARRPTLPIVVATGFADMAAVESVVGADRVLRKPFRLDDLGMAVRAALVEAREAEGVSA